MFSKDENGFTLVELVISMGMFSIVLTAILVFMTNGARSYKYSSDELALQQESQMLITQIRDMVYEANYAEKIPAYDGVTGNDALVIYNVEKTVAKSATGASVVSYNVLDKKTIYYNASNKKLYIDDHDTSSDPDAKTKDSSYAIDDDRLFARYLTSFNIDSINKNAIKLSFDMKKGSRKYNIEAEDITIRNRWVTYTP